MYLILLTVSCILNYTVRSVFLLIFVPNSLYYLSDCLDAFYCFRIMIFSKLIINISRISTIW